MKVLVKIPIFVWIGAATVAIIVAGAYFLTRSQATQLVGESIPILGAQHIPAGSVAHPPYNSNPPTSGWHWPQPAAWGTYDAELPDEQVIHNLEHGGVWIAYKVATASAGLATAAATPSQIGDDEINKLKEIASRFRKIILAPRSANDSAIAVASWGQLLKLDKLDEGQIVKFIKTNIEHGPESAP